MNTHDPYKELTARIELLNRLIRENNEECDVEERIPSHIQSAAEELTDLAKPFAAAPALYEALKGLLGGPGIDVSETALIIGPNAREAIIAARAALASATPQATGE